MTAFAAGAHEHARPTFHLRPRFDRGAESYWVEASTSAMARRLVALNVEGADDVRDLKKFDCVFDRSERPSEGFIHRSQHPPVAIVER